MNLEQFLCIYVQYELILLKLFLPTLQPVFSESD